MLRAAYAGKPLVESHRFQAQVHILSIQILPGGWGIIGGGTAQGLHPHGIHVEQAALHAIGEYQAALALFFLRPQPVNGDGAFPAGIDQDGGENMLVPAFLPDGQVKVAFSEKPVGDTGPPRALPAAGEQGWQQTARTPAGVPEPGRVR